MERMARLGEIFLEWYELGGGEGGGSHDTQALVLSSRSAELSFLDKKINFQANSPA